MGRALDFFSLLNSIFLLWCRVGFRFLLVEEVNKVMDIWRGNGDTSYARMEFCRGKCVSSFAGNG